MNSKIILISTIFLCFEAFCNAAFSDCGSEVGSIVSVDIIGCDDKPRCPLKKGTNATMNITFKSNVDTTNLKAVVYGVIGVKIPFELPNDDGCKDSGIVCPIKAGETYRYTTTMPILTSYPRVTVDILWELQNDEGKDIICARIPSKIVK
ncbi:NPC intracellular cholesterol transporter 2 homolog a [Leptinotarsa decemlineata]|uniref:NPC intracellular cholesterol transporter 2 homolog a n=1 Tax=Leptinotarsa decemlineata TaxID=7539 RepID=UPI003D30B89B